jgi:hypothetical protein
MVSDVVRDVVPDVVSDIALTNRPTIRTVSGSQYSGPRFPPASAGVTGNDRG